MRRVTSLVVAALSSLAAAVASSAGPDEVFISAYFSAGEPAVILFTVRSARSSRTAISLPRELMGFNIITFGADGRSLYLRSVSGAGVTKVEFGPTRRTVVPGSEGLVVWFLTVSKSGAVLVSATDAQTRQCGAYAIDPSNGTRQSLRVGSYPDCAGALVLLCYKV